MKVVFFKLLYENISETCSAILSHQKSLGTGMGGQSVEDLERVIAAMRRVVERLQGENDQLKKTVGAGGPQYGEVLKENKRLKVFRLFLFLLFFFSCLFYYECHSRVIS